jgi:hypothetical protein
MVKKQINQSAKEESNMPTSIRHFQINYLFLMQQWIPLHQGQSSFWNNSAMRFQLSRHPINQSLLLKTSEYEESNLPGGMT